MLRTPVHLIAACLLALGATTACELDGGEITIADADPIDASTADTGASDASAADVADDTAARDASADTATADVADDTATLDVADDTAAPDTGTDTAAPDTTEDTGSAWVPDDDDFELVQVINDYRVSRGLPAIPVSDAMMTVAVAHAQDLAAAYDTFAAGCNLHSWSDDGPWTGCCYTSDHAQAECMWNKPRELTDYPGNGYEISAAGYDSAQAALAGWQSSSGHHNVIINADIWEDITWQAIGGADVGGYQVVWFGAEADR